MLLTAVTFGAALLAREWPWLNGLNARKFWKVVGCVVFGALLVRLGSDALTNRKLGTASEPPQNLLQQYYRGNSGVSALLREYAEVPEAQQKHQLVLVSPYDVPTCSHYWMLHGLPDKGTGGLFLNMPANLATAENLLRYRQAGYGFLILARHEREALEWAWAAGFPEPQVVPEGEAFDHHCFFRIVQQ